MKLLVASFIVLLVLAGRSEATLLVLLFADGGLYVAADSGNRIVGKGFEPEGACKTRGLANGMLVALTGLMDYPAGHSAARETRGYPSFDGYGLANASTIKARQASEAARLYAQQTIEHFKARLAVKPTWIADYMRVERPGETSGNLHSMVFIGLGEDGRASICAAYIRGSARGELVTEITACGPIEALREGWYYAAGRIPDPTAFRLSLAETTSSADTTGRLIAFIEKQSNLHPETVRLPASVVRVEPDGTFKRASVGACKAEVRAGRLGPPRRNGPSEP
jgi:hypothetical protein